MNKVAACDSNLWPNRKQTGPALGTTSFLENEGFREEFQAGIAEASGEVDRTRMMGMGTWAETWPNQMRNRPKTAIISDVSDTAKVIAIVELFLRESYAEPGTGSDAGSF